MAKIEASNVRPNSPEEAITMLIRLLTELEAREISFNCIVDEYIGVPWNELCDKGIKLFEYLKSDQNTKPDSQKQALSTSQAEKLKSYITNILKCDMQHHKGCLAPNCFTCIESRCYFALAELFPEEHAKRLLDKAAKECNSNDTNTKNEVNMKISSNIDNVINYLIQKKNEGYTSVELIDNARAAGWDSLTPTLNFVVCKNHPNILGIDAREQTK